jgi:hypothetical protein
MYYKVIVANGCWSVGLVVKEIPPPRNWGGAPADFVYVTSADGSSPLYEAASYRAGGGFFVLKRCLESHNPCDFDAVYEGRL